MLGQSIGQFKKAVEQKLSKYAYLKGTRIDKDYAWVIVCVI